MAELRKFLEFLNRVLLWGVAAIPKIGVQMGLAVISMAGVISTMFSKFTWLNSATSYVQNATTVVSQFMQRDFGVIGNVLLGWFALDHLSQVAIVTITATIGVTVVVFVTIFVSVMTVVPSILIVRGIMKALQTASIGILDP